MSRKSLTYSLDRSSTSPASFDAGPQPWAPSIPPPLSTLHMHRIAAFGGTDGAITPYAVLTNNGKAFGVGSGPRSESDCYTFKFGVPKSGNMTLTSFISPA
ncbi:hypothetical protein RSOLAG1IB_10604 [Rhizoctonia solani AG-1 IB]|uniref:Uncharacterized protein n=1 Tax=Thanatephorus cucumeris (strain AG1-IB / isolate 7/3/14) TaxID=1108050 RepID=A0A0B7G1I1_THACB|nr:hypothetical protein RSOLAG1IB_10604 [Rhizoctonia solani AG-1 IB]